MEDDVTPPFAPTNDAPAVPPSSPPVSQPPATTPPASTDTNTRMDRMESLLASLTETVAKLIPSDHAPVKRPWTHAGSSRKRGE